MPVRCDSGHPTGIVKTSVGTVGVRILLCKLSAFQALCWKGRGMFADPRRAIAEAQSLQAAGELCIISKVGTRSYTAIS